VPAPRGTPFRFAILPLDVFVRRYIHENFSYRFVILADGKAALAFEAAIKAGEWERGRPLLNPWKMKLG
jgi:hypothetical protein